ncbi:MAG: tRNA (N6-isopentenyl adenosine(37)-C2)-methylthiotransferase MiaB [Epsilonproteobacteria bacterium]|nr:tRNA (N6-isopentenyl adenosine(37)-C2)-methylthiotransferase MiaB [Campylobacterota bacterium]
MDKNSQKERIVYIKTFGCQMNFHDSDILRELLIQSGYLVADGSDDAGTIIFNTCTVRDHADSKFYSELGRYSKSDKKIIVAGCLSQIAGRSLIKRAPFVHAVVGPQYLYEIPYIITGGSVVLTDDNPEFYIHSRPEIKKLSASVDIMYGCSRFCSYCIVPYTRGREISRKPDDIYDEICRAAENGAREITLLGQNVNAYSYEDVDFAALLKKIAAISGISRIKFMSPNPASMTDRQIKEIANIPKCVPHIHLPLQSGSDRILKLMKRGYNSSGYMKKVEKIEKYIKDAILTTDIIVGFPTETEQDFKQTLKIVGEVGFFNSFMFCYSKRSGTQAGAMEGQVSMAASKERLGRLIEYQQNITVKKLERYKGSIMSIFVDKQKESGFAGRTRQDIVINVEGGSAALGKFVPVEVCGISKHTLKGKELA